MAGRPGKLMKSKSQDLLDLIEYSTPSNAFTSKMKKVFQSSPIMKKRRVQSFNTCLGTTSKAFGVPLTQLLTPPNLNDPRKKLSLPAEPHLIIHSKIPPIVVKIVEHIERNGLDQEGIYRVNGNSKLVDRLRATFNESGDADLTDVDIYTVGSLLKLFLRQLPDPLIPDIIIDEVVELQESISESKTADAFEKLKTILTTLPEENYQLLNYLCKHLFFVSEHKAATKMTVVSLSIVFGPNVFRCGGELIDLKKQGYANSAFAQMVERHRSIFADYNTIQEIDELRSASTASDDVFLPSDDKGKKRPHIPLPYHEHKARLTSSQGSVSLPSSPVHILSSESLHVTELVSSSERSIDEAVNEVEGEKIRQPQSATISIPKLNKHKSMSDDILTGRGPSPSSWNSKSSPGTSPSTSPIITPRTSQAYTTLLGDSIQDHLFQSTETSPKPLPSEDPSSSTTTEVPYQVVRTTSAESNTESLRSTSSSNETVQLRETSFIRRNNALRNRKSSVYGSDSSIENTTERDNEEQLVQLLTIDEAHVSTTQELNVSTLAKNNNNKDETTDDKQEATTSTTTTATTTSIRDNFEKKGLILQFATKDTSVKSLLPAKQETSLNDKPDTESPYLEMPDADKLTMSTKKKHPSPIVAKKPKRSEPDQRYVAHDFDYVTQRVEILTHPTKQRVKGPRNRKRPSSRLPSDSFETTDTFTLTPNTISQSMTVTKSRRERSAVPLIAAANMTDANDIQTSSPTVSLSEPQTSHVITTLAHVTTSPSHVTTSPSHVIRSPSHVTTSPSHVSTASPTTTTVLISSSSNITASHVTTPTSHVTTSSSMISEQKTVTSPVHATTIASPSHDITSIMSPSHTTVTSSKPHVSTHASRATSEQIVTSSPHQVGPTGSVSIVPAGWTAGHEEESLSYEELIEKARQLRTIVKTFERDFFIRNGRNPTNEESMQIAEENASLTAIKKKLRALRSHQGVLNKTAPPHLTSEVTDHQLASLSAVKIDEDTPKDRTIRRHQSFNISSSYSKDNPYHLVMQSIQKSLEEKRQEEGIPETLESMTNDQLQQEKHLIQKALINFEKKNGRPQGSDSKAIMRPLYDRYRRIKRVVSTRERVSIQPDSGMVVYDESGGAHEDSMVVYDESGGAHEDTRDEKGLWSVTMIQSTPPPPPLALSGREEQISQESPQLNKGLKYSPSGPEAVSPRGRFKSVPTVTVKPQLQMMHPKSVSTASSVEHDWMSDDQLERATVGELHQQLLLAHAIKKGQRQLLRMFETGFLEKEKRPIENADKKKLMYSEYTQYRMIKNRVSLLDTLLSKYRPQNTI